MEKKKLHPGAKWVFRIGAYISGVIFASFIAFSLAALLFKTGLGGSLVAVVVIFIFIVLVILVGEIYAQMSYNRWFYTLESNGLKLERGIIWKKFSNIPYERVQNVDIQRGLIARLFGFSTVEVQTAGYGGGYSRGGRIRSEGYIPAVGVEEAEKIRDFVTGMASKKTKGGL